LGGFTNHLVRISEDFAEGGPEVFESRDAFAGLALEIMASGELIDGIVAQLEEFVGQAFDFFRSFDVLEEGLGLGGVLEKALGGGLVFADIGVDLSEGSLGFSPVFNGSAEEGGVVHARRERG
jgi:hypothetical protein